MLKTLSTIQLFLLLITIACTNPRDIWVTDNPHDEDGSNWFPPTLALHWKHPSFSAATDKQELLVGDTLILKAATEDANGKIIAVIWTIDDEEITDASDSLFRTVFNDTGHHVLSAVAMDNDSVFSDPCTTFFNVLYDEPQLRLPDNDKYVHYNEVTLAWARGIYAKEYTVLADTVSPPTTIIAMKVASDSLVHTFKGFKQKWYWRVLEQDDDGSVDTGDIWTFTTPPQLPTDGLYAEWLMNSSLTDDVSGTVGEWRLFDWYDLFGLISMEGSWVDDRFGIPQTALDGGHILTKISLSTLQQMTIVFWYRIGDRLSDWGGFVGLSEDSIGNRVLNFPIMVHYDSSSLKVIGPRTWNDTTYTGYHSSYSIKNNDTWQMATCVFPQNGRFSDVIVYHDTTKLNIDTVTGIDRFYEFKYHMVIENKSYLDDMRIYDRPLSEEEIIALYQEGGWGY